MQKFMTVSEIAKEANVSVRTLQYYDKSGLLKPSAYTESGNRLYTDKELVILFQIKGLKQLGLSLNEIKKQMVSLSEPGKVLEILQKQKESIQENINNLQLTISAIEVLERDIKNSEEVNFSGYAKILSGARDNWDCMWGFSTMNEDLKDHIVDKFINKSAAKAIDFNKQLTDIIDAIITAQEKNIQPTSPEGEELISAFWNLINGFLDGNMNLIPSLQEFEKDIKNQTGEFATKWRLVEPFLNAQPDRFGGETCD